MSNINFPINVIVSQQGIQGVPGNTTVLNTTNANYRMQNGQFQIYDMAGTGNLLWRAIGISGGSIILSNLLPN